MRTSINSAQEKLNILDFQIWMTIHPSPIHFRPVLMNYVARPSLMTKWWIYKLYLQPTVKVRTCDNCCTTPKQITELKVYFDPLHIYLQLVRVLIKPLPTLLSACTVLKISILPRKSAYIPTIDLNIIKNNKFFGEHTWFVLILCLRTETGKKGYFESLCT